MLIAASLSETAKLLEQERKDLCEVALNLCGATRISLSMTDIRCLEYAVQVGKSSMAADITRSLQIKDTKRPSTDSRESHH